MDKIYILGIINACSDFLKLDKIMSNICDGGISGDEYRGLWELPDILAMYFDVDDYTDMINILRDNNLSIEEKYDKINRKEK